MKYYTAAAQAGDAKANCNLGVMYHNGAGVSRDAQLAVKYFTAAAQAGHAEANYSLGVMYDSGAGVRGSKAGSEIIHRCRTGGRRRGKMQLGRHVPQ